MHNRFQVTDVFNESVGYVASQWILPCSPNYCAFLQLHALHFFARGNGRKGQKGLSGQNHTIALNGDVAPY